MFNDAVFLKDICMAEEGLGEHVEGGEEMGNRGRVFGKDSEWEDRWEMERVGVARYEFEKYGWDAEKGALEKGDVWEGVEKEVWEGEEDDVKVEMKDEKV